MDYTYSGEFGAKYYMWFSNANIYINIQGSYTKIILKSRNEKPNRLEG